MTWNESGVCIEPVKNGPSSLRSSPLAQAFVLSSSKPRMDGTSEMALQTLEACHQGRQLLREYGLTMLKTSFKERTPWGPF